VVYGVACAGCHRELENTQLRGKNAQAIQKAIDNDKGGMGVLTVLSTQEIDAIAAVLAEPGGGD
jgi:mono/diheme cytochrome c family protein